MLLHPTPVDPLQADAAGDTEPRVCLELPEKPGEEVALERHVGVDLDDDVRGAGKLEPAVECPDHWSSARHRTGRLEGRDTDPGIAADELPGDGRRLVF